MIDFEATEQMLYLVSVGTASLYSQLLHFKRQTVYKENFQENVSYLQRLGLTRGWLQIKLNTVT